MAVTAEANGSSAAMSAINAGYVWQSVIERPGYIHVYGVHQRRHLKNYLNK